jgi:microcystin-dependent protein
MPRNGSGTHSIPNSFSSGSTISSSAMNANFTDIATEMTNSLPRDGQASMTGQFKAASGTSALPGVAFGSDTDTGFYRKASNTIGVSAGGTEVGTIDSNGFNTTLGVLVPIPTGVILPYGATTSPTGWVRCNARTIGNASSSATERANADTETLFTFLWNNYSDSVCSVPSGRGVSAAADYAANKTIALPDLRGRGIFGLDDMGNSAASRLGSVITSQTSNGASGGSETVTLTTAEMPSHSHTGTHAHTHTGGFPTPVTSNAASSPNNFTALQAAGTTNTGAASDANLTINNTGGGGAHSNMPPAFLATFIIKL